MNRKYWILITLAMAMLTSKVFSQNAPRAEHTDQPTESAEVRVNAAQAIARSVSNQPLIQAAEAAVESARAKLGQARSAYYPDINGTASWDHVIPNEQLLFGGELFTLAPTDYWDFNAGAHQLIYDFGKREFNVKLAKSGIDAALINVSQIKTNIAFETLRTFYSVLFLGKEAASFDERIENLEQHRRDAENREKTGSSTHLDVVTTEVNIANVKSDRIDAADQLERQKSRLRQLLGLDPDEPLVAEGDFTSDSKAGDASSLVGKALDDRPDLLQAANSVEMASLDKTLAVLGNRPSITAGAGLGFKNGLFTVDNTDLNALEFNWNVGVALNVPIFDGFMTANRRAEAEGSLAAAKDEVEDLRRTIEAQVVQAIRSLAASRSRVENSADQLTQTKQALDIARAQYTLGVITNLQYLDSQTSLELAKLNRLNALYKEALSEVDLEQAVGEDIWNKEGER
jgi:outer membrane protein TolC